VVGKPAGGDYLVAVDPFALAGPTSYDLAVDQAAERAAGRAGASRPA
jgi:hypothetical protein